MFARHGVMPEGASSKGKLTCEGCGQTLADVAKLEFVAPVVDDQ